MNTINASKRYRLMRAINRIPGVIAYNPLNEIQGTSAVNYAAGGKGSFTGVNSNITLSQGGKYGRGYSLNGTTSGVTSSVWLARTINISFGCIFKTTDYTQTRQPIMSNGAGGGGQNGYAIVLSGNGNTDGSMYLLSHNSAWQTLNFKVQDALFHIVTATIDSAGTLVVYLDGVQKFSAAAVTLFTPDTNSLIGKDNAAGGFFKGIIQHAFVINRAITAAENRKIAHAAGFI